MDIMIQIQRRAENMHFWINVNNHLVYKYYGCLYTSLSTIETNGEGLTSIISKDDLDRICKNFCLASERKTPYYCPKVVRGGTWLTCHYFKYGGCDHRDGAAYFLQYRGRDIHTECLAASGKINMDAKEFRNNLIGINDPRIRYGSKPYHPYCFGHFHKYKIDAKDIAGYEALDDANKAVLDKYIKKSDDYDIPTVNKAYYDEYCCAEECLESETPSKFPYPYTIKSNLHLQIKFQNKLYHPKCLQASGKVNIDAKDVKNYNALTQEERHSIDQIFKKTE
uniref:Uncharacterized protein n=1 Tax=Panagrolaimus superbus TaxID=310955 RepID=A0A914Y3P9_9BILA